MNKVMVTGRWVKDLEKNDKSSLVIVKGSLAVDEGFGDKKYTSYLDVIFFGKAAENVHKHSGKGRKVLIEGRLRQERWDGKDGKKNSAVRVYADAIEFLDHKEDSKKETVVEDDDLPF